jgi:transcriptional regulator with XRE-family HTH domain
MEQTLGKRIAARRKELGLTQEALAEKLGITAQAVSKWENDQSCPDISTLPRLAEILGVSTDTLLGCTQQPVHEGEVVDTEQKTEKNNFEFHWFPGRQKSLLVAAGVVWVGVLTFLSRWYGWDASFWEILWPSFFLFYGLSGIFPRFSAFRLGLALFGGYYLGTNLHIWHLSISGELIFPICVVLFGLGLLADALRKPRKPIFTFQRNGEDAKKTQWDYHVEGGHLECSLSFGNQYIQPQLEILAGGEFELNFGNLTVDLSGCKQVQEPCTLEVDCNFGEMVLRLPRHIRVEPETDTACGNIRFRGQPDDHVTATVILEADVSFGQLKVEYV